MLRKFIVFLVLFNLTCKISSQENDTIKEEDIFSYSLDEILSMKVITAGKKYEEIKDIPASAVVITKKDIERLGFTTYTEIFEHINGFYLINDYYWLGSLNYGVRGFFSTGPFNDVIILVNGVSQMSDKYSDYPDVKINIPVEAIKRIEIIKGPMSVIYGSGAFFGAINIITNEVDDKKPANFVTASYGSLKTGKAALRLSGKEGKIKYVFNASFYSTEGIDVPFRDLTDNINLIEYVGLTPDATTKGQFNDDRRYISLFLEHENLYFDFSYTESRKDIFDGQPSFADGSLMTTKAANIFLGYKKTFSDKISGEFKGGYYSHGHLLDYELFRPHYYEIDGQTSNSISAELNIFYNPLKKLETTFGLNRRAVLSVFQVSDFGYYGLNYGQGETGLPRGEHYATNSLFVRVKYSLHKKISLIGGLRIEHLEAYNMHYSRGTITENPDDNRPPDSTELRQVIEARYQPENNGITLIPNLAAIFYLNQHNILKILYGQATKQPSFSENYRQLPNNRPQLNAAKIETYELNYIFDLESEFSISLSLFHNKLENLISSTNIYNLETGDWEIYSANSGKLETNGIEADIKYSPFYRLQINLSGTLQETRNNKEGYENIVPGYSPRFLGYGNISYQLSKHTSISIIGRYIDKMESIWRTESTPENGGRIGNSTEPCFIFDTNLRISNFLNTGLYLNFKTTNIFDTEIRYPTTTSNAWANKGTLGPGRRIILSIGYKF